MSAGALCVPLSLAPGAILRIDRGARIGLRAAAGLVWLTELGNPHDSVLAAGDSVRLSRNGRALVAASAPSRIVLEFPQDLGTAPRLELAESEGERGRELPIPQLASGHAARIRGAIAGLLRTLFDRGPRSGTVYGHGGSLDGHLSSGALAIRTRSLRREDAWHGAAIGIDALAPRESRHPWY